MTYNVFGGTLNLTESITQLKQAHCWTRMRKHVEIWYRQTDLMAGWVKSSSESPLTSSQSIYCRDSQTHWKASSTSLLSDYFTKWAEAYLLRDTETSTCMCALYNNLFSSFSLPRQLYSDQDKNLETRLFHKLCTLAGIRKSKMTPFHAQSDGETERMNRTLLQTLTATCQSNPQHLSQKLSTVMSAYRMTVHKVTAVTANLATLGREELFTRSQL